MKRVPGAPDGALPIAGSTLYVPGLTNSGYVDGLMIDTGPDESVYEFASADRLAITHGHADHFACGAYLRKRGATVVAARDDAALVENPDINIRGMFSWAKPGDILVSKLFKGIPCRVDALVEKWRDPRAKPVSLPGHTLGHTGFLTADKVLFTGDALYLEALWARHPLPYAIDPDMVATSLESLRAVDFDWLVPGHGTLVDRETAEKDIAFHLEQIEDIEASILEMLLKPQDDRGVHRGRLGTARPVGQPGSVLARGHHREGLPGRSAQQGPARVLGRQSRRDVEDRRVALPQPYKLRTARTIRSTISSRISREVAKLSRANPAPSTPKSRPAESATRPRSRISFLGLIAESELSEVQPRQVGGLGCIEAEPRAALPRAASRDGRAAR